MGHLQVIELKGIRVLTSAQIAECYETTRDRIKQNFKENKARFKEVKHYIALVGDELKKFKNEVGKNDLVGDMPQNEVRNFYPVTNKVKYQFDTQFKYAKSLYLWTEKGALLHAKSLNTDKAWEVYDYLVDFYFRAKEKEEPRKPIVPVTDMTKPLKNEMSIKNSIPEDKTRQAGYDIAPAFRELISLLPVEALDAMEKCFRDEKSRVVKLAAIGVLAEKMKRQLA